MRYVGVDMREDTREVDDIELERQLVEEQSPAHYPTSDDEE